MKRRVVTLALGLVMALTMVGGASASDAPGIPGENNCHGQTVRYLAQLGKEAGVQEAHGLGGLAAYYQSLGVDYSVQDLQDIAAAYCDQV